ncbi:hypothetical protein Nepgr_010077 [Nepenthes gracilis]|uniref:Uncharacterized protein n=1 Tax=Nepenthes gracilis TaxID=150966 RepID=A0AAD3SCP9_NEPGR|nr:hypothetical protein Nepgr_010077 [Nepenthes gracilis]
MSVAPHLSLEVGLFDLEDFAASIIWRGKRRFKEHLDLQSRNLFYITDTDGCPPQSNRLTRVLEASTVRSASNENRKSASASPEKEERYYTTRGSVGGGGGGDENGKSNTEAGGGEEKGSTIWPKLYITLSSKEKEEDFLAMKGCKLPQRPKKRAKFIQRTLLLVSPGAWLSDMCQERYEVREKKTSKKRARGLKAMGSLDSDSE